MRNLRLRLFLVASTSLVSCTPALAQSNPDEIVVTARRVEERLQDVPISMTVFDDTQLDNRNVTSGADLATYTPSLSANSRYGPEAASFALRGFVQENFTSPSVAVYFADVIGPRAQGGTPGGNGAGVGQFFDLQNVQILKGPQGTLFGRNTTGGAVLIVPQRPKDELGGYLEGSYGNFDMYRLQGVLNVPLSDTFKVRLGFERHKRDGYLKNRSDIGPDALGDVNYWAVRAAVVADLTPNLENYTIVRYSHSDSNGITGKVTVANAAGCDQGVDRSRFGLPTAGTTASFLAPIACAQGIARSRSQNYGYWDVENGNPDPYLKIDQWSVINTTTWNASDTITIKNIASYQQFAQRQAFNIGADNYVIPASNPNPAFRGLPFTWVGLAPDPNLPNVEQYTATEELQIQGRSSDGKLNYVLGGYYETSGPLSPFQGSYSPISYTSNVTVAPGVTIPVLATISCTDLQALQCRGVDSLGTGRFPGLVQNSLTRYDYENIGFFAQGTYNLTDQLSVTGGIRYTIDKVTGEGATRQIFFYAPNTPTFTCAAYPTRSAVNPENCLTQIKQKSEKPTWLIDIDYKPIPDVLLYAKYSRGYRQGNVNASNTVPVAWGPEKVDAYEIGAKTSFRGTVSGYFNVAAFYNDFSDQQLAANLVPDPSIPNNTNSPAQAIVNAGKSKIQGVEIDAAINAYGAGVSVGYAYLDTELKSYSPPVFAGYLPPTTGALVGGALPQSPKHRITITPSYTLPLDESLGQVTIAATYTYTAKQVASNDTPLGILPSSNLWNLNLNWNSIGGSPVDLAGFVTNLTNEKYPIFVGNSWLSTGTESLILGQPRMYGVRLKVRFGGE
ncbi:TonB-dependent receptor [Novosphingobium soli]|uniref:TonB-dependent receptor n=1 Tax=Novosphingobium soli TaxID=574956 RepID=A0ABV6CUD6_9SPHN